MSRIPHPSDYLASRGSNGAMWMRFKAMVQRMPSLRDTDPHGCSIRTALVSWMRLILILALGSFEVAFAAPADRLVPRTIIALYDSAEDSWEETFIHDMAEKPLNHLGLVLEPHDIRDPLPDLRQRTDV